MRNCSRRQAISRPVQTRVNDRIRVREVRLIDDEGQQIGVVPTREALMMAREKGLDLVEVAANAQPPVCRLMDYGKYRYEQSRKERETRKNQHVTKVKEVRVEPKIGGHDLETKGRQAERFLKAGDKVKLSVLFRGRSITHPELGRDLLQKLSEQLSEVGAVEQGARMEGRTMTMYMAPARAKSESSGSGSEKEG
ncbi:MAG: translation initiation factor IF-3 [Chloroflexia bacterium]|jgi:translation initiation factor IF-3|nr:translation initiation factor IF-3 [Chloroflexia bacterium]MDQ3524292.1 translation initiation factor IF-3 [Chloroflexota bacterium]